MSRHDTYVQSTFRYTKECGECKVIILSSEEKADMVKRSKKGLIQSKENVILG